MSILMIKKNASGWRISRVKSATSSRRLASNITNAVAAKAIARSLRNENERIVRVHSGR